MKHSQIKLEGWFDQYRPDGTSRTRRFSDEQIADVIENCRKPSDDAVFAAKHGMSISYARQIRQRQTRAIQRASR